MQNIENKNPRKLLRKVALAAIVAAFFLSAGAIAVDGFFDRISASDVAIVLGSKVNPDGSVSPRLAARLDKTVELYRHGIFSNVIVSGGTGKEGVDEAVAMKKYLLARQIPAPSILVDSHGDTTMHTAINSAAIMRAHGFKSALLVSQYFHISRSRLALKRCGISSVYNAHPDFFEWRDMYSLAREVVGFYDYFLRPGDCASPVLGQQSL
ncbi:YdcF family protein [Paraherbaspirillum soli]|uniref:YdcF family protein n=1 Tax=Paraherbaspirillum soli TaxID=631222 RepID=A0ABW0M794_9BURK